jgi:hypothetical protein
MGERLTITIPLFLTDHPHTKTAISLPELVRQTNAFSKKYRPGCVPSLLDSNPKALFLQYNVKCNKKDSDPAGHDVRIQFDVTKVVDSQQAKDLDVQISCSCPAFLYWGAQWNLHQRDGLLGNPRPKLVAPTERLDLRANFVICKHVHSVFERILPSVQHNIVKILRDRELRKNKDKVRETPSRLKKLQDEMREKREKEKILNTKDKKTRDGMLEALKNEEQSRLMHEQELRNKGEAPGEVGRENPAMEPEELEVAEAVPEQGLPTEDEDEEDLSAIQSLLKDEEGKIEELHKEHKPHVHKGLPYDIAPEPEEGDEDKVIRKFESLGEKRAEYTLDDFKKGMRVRALTGRPGHPEEMKEGTVTRTIPPSYVVEVDWDGMGLATRHPRNLFPLQQRLFSARREKALGIDVDMTPENSQPGVRVYYDNYPDTTGTIIEMQGTAAVVRWDKNGWEKTIPISSLRLHVAEQSKMLFSHTAMKYENAAKGMRVKLIRDPKRKVLGTIKKILQDGDGARYGIVVKWDAGHESTVEAWELHEHTTQRNLFAAEVQRLFAASNDSSEPR